MPDKFGWVCGICDYDSLESFPTPQGAKEDAEKHMDRLHPDSSAGPPVVVEWADSVEKRLPFSEPFGVLCGRCMEVVTDWHASPDRANEEGEMHRREEHEEGTVILSVVNRDMMENHREEVLERLREDREKVLEADGDWRKLDG